MIRVSSACRFQNPMQGRKLLSPETFAKCFRIMQLEVDNVADCHLGAR